MRKTGSYQILGDISYFIPDPLPPQSSPLMLSSELMQSYADAQYQLGKLSGMTHALPDTARFVRAYVIKEALLSSEIEGIHTTLLDVFTQPLSSTLVKDKQTQLVLNYTHALEIACEMIQQKGLPISSRVILAAHRSLMSLGEGDRARPGHYREQSVRVGELITAPAQRITGLMTQLERYINEPDELPSLIKAGLVHVQFETIHPFLDGNGRIGRMLIVLMLIEAGLLESPLLYPSYYFKLHRQTYYERLNAVRTQGDFEGWITFYLQAIIMTAKDALQRAEAIELLRKSVFAQIEADSQFTRIRATAQATVALLFEEPVVSAKRVSQALEKSYNTARNILQQLVTAGLLSKQPGRQRNQLYSFDAYVQLLEKDMA